MRHFINQVSTKSCYKKCLTILQKHGQNKKNNNYNKSATNKNIKYRKQNKKSQKKNNKKTTDLKKIFTFLLIRSKYQKVVKKALDIQVTYYFRFKYDYLAKF